MLFRSISKIDMGRQPLTLSETDIRELLYDSIRAVEPAAAASGITITPDFPETPVIVSCDDTQLRRAVTNILSNGVRYARSELRLTCRADKRHVTIRIQDDGDGIAEEDLPHICGACGHRSGSGAYPLPFRRPCREERWKSP